MNRITVSLSDSDLAPVQGFARKLGASPEALIQALVLDGIASFDLEDPDHVNYLMNKLSDLTSKEEGG